MLELASFSLSVDLGKPPLTSSPLPLTAAIALQNLHWEILVFSKSPFSSNSNSKLA